MMWGVLTLVATWAFLYAGKEWQTSERFGVAAGVLSKNRMGCRMLSYGRGSVGRPGNPPAAAERKSLQRESASGAQSVPRRPSQR